ncbi:hypothetical protein BV25DRAFT_1829439 [Artomyces pyxidatus]|uniref:Uncharacterized protein n=1 Tax=Artomyces pyxidatus TaxID=48021 RepID=A0ACB8SRQ2_9AGAM|nr:hypothetical protein BV25DRAFT_1829439 [Artomyces pyxidatus]
MHHAHKSTLVAHSIRLSSSLLVFLALLILLRRLLREPPPQSSGLRHADTAQKIQGQWRNVHAVLGIPTLPDTVPIPAPDSDGRRFGLRFDLRKRMDVPGRDEKVQWFLAEDAELERVVGTGAIRQSFRQAAEEDEERARERERGKEERMKVIQGKTSEGSHAIVRGSLRGMIAKGG